MSVYKQNLRAYMEYGEGEDIKRVEITSFTISYGLREIPTAMVSVAVGRDTSSGKLQPAIDSPDPDVPARIYTTISGQRLETAETWDDAPKLVYRGFIGSLAATRLSNRCAGNFVIRHILSSLQSANLLAFYAAPGDSAELVLPAYRVNKAKAGADPDDGSQPVGSLSALMQQEIVFVDPGQTLVVDLWADIAKPFLIRVSQQNEFYPAAAFPSCFEGAGGDNVKALEALATIEGVTDDEYSLERDNYGTPVTLPEGAPSLIGSAIRSLLTRPNVATLMQQTAWSYIITNICNPLMLTLSPGIKRSRVIPVAPTLTRYYKELTVNSLQVLDRNRPVEHPFLATTMSAGELSSAGGARSAQVGEPFAFGPCYSPANASPQGQVNQVPPPPWLRSVTFTAFDPTESSRLADGVGGGVFGDEDGDDVDADVDAADTADMQRVSAQDYGQRFVKSVYAHEMTAARTMKLISHFRADIAPGSQLKVIVDDGITGFGNVVYAMVTRVTLSLDGTSPMAATSYLLTHVRSEDENKPDFVGDDEHPLFAEAFVGGPLSDDFE